MLLYTSKKCFSDEQCGMWASAVEMSFPFRYEMGSPGVFWGNCQQQWWRWVFWRERNIWLTTISLLNYTVEYLRVARKIESDSPVHMLMIPWP